jgi:hypothetical protein
MEHRVVYLKAMVQLTAFRKFVRAIGLHRTNFLGDWNRRFLGLYAIFGITIFTKLSPSLHSGR